MSGESERPIFGLNPDQLSRLWGVCTRDIDEEDIQASRPAPTATGGPAQTPDASDRAAPFESALEHIGQSIGPYKLVAVLGEGGMGIVYLAQQEHPIKRQVALKVIKPGMDSTRVIARFEVERQALALLDHPNIAHVHDAGMTDAGRPYFIMEYIKGLPLTEYCDHHRLTIEQRLRLFQQVCEAVQHAHQKGIIHRDLKPSNILVPVDNDPPIPKIIDFGVAKALNRSLTERTLLTEDNQLVGTPEYMSPEQADAACEDIDTRSDVYSLGALLYVLLAGVPPFDAQQLRQGGLERIRRTICEDDPKAPSTRLATLGEEATRVAESRRTEVQALTRCLGRELEWIPLKAMRKDRAERYRSASELSSDIESYLQQGPLMAGPLTTMYRLKKTVRKHRAFVGGSAAVLVVLLAGTLVSAIFAWHARQQAKNAQAVADFLGDDILGSVVPSELKGRELTLRYVLDVASEKLEGRFQNQPLVEASIRLKLGLAYRGQGEPCDAELHLRRARDIYREELGETRPETMSATDNLGWVYLDEGQYVKAAELLAEALAVVRRRYGEEDKRTLGLMNVLATTYKDLGRYNEAERLFSRGAEIGLRVLGKKQNVTLFMVGNLGQTYEEQGRYREAEREYLRTLQLSEGTWDEENQWRLVYECFLARTYTAQRRYREAESLFLTTVDGTNRIWAEESLVTLRCMAGLAHLYACQRRYDEAAPLFADVVEVASRRLGDDHMYTLRFMNSMAEMYLTQGRYGDAEALFLKALEAGRRVLGEDHPDVLTSKHGLGMAYLGKARYEEAEPLLVEAFNGRKNRLGLRLPRTRISLHGLVCLYESWSKPEEAAKWRVNLVQTQAAEK
jgi:serine/threonine protein kinase/tetratricopeptide (TPR) repeat protein